MNEQELMYDWTPSRRWRSCHRRNGSSFDETLRDGIQSPSVVDPSIDDKLRLVDLANDLGSTRWTSACPAPAARRRGRHHDRAAHQGWKAARERSCARAHAHQRRAGSHRHLAGGRHRDRGAVLHRQLADPAVREDWDLSRMMKLSADAIDLGRKYNLPVAYVTEDTTRSRPRCERSCSRTRSSTARRG